MEERDELFTPGFYRDLVNSQAETNATLRLLAERLGSATDGLEHLEPILTDFGKRLSTVEGQIRTTKKALRWGASIVGSCVGGFLTYRKEITQTLKQFLQ